MTTQQDPHGTVAALAILGAFATLITIVVTHTPLTGPLLGIIAGCLGTVLGFYFGAAGARNALELARVAMDHAAATAAAVPSASAQSPLTTDVAPATSVRT